MLNEGTVRILLNLLEETFAKWQDDNASRLAAALSYYMVFSLAPFLPRTGGVSCPCKFRYILCSMRVVLYKPP